MFKKNTAVVGFGIGNFINASTGATVTTGTPVETRLIDGTGAALTNAATYNTDAAQWEIDLEAADMNGDVIGLNFALASCLPISYTIKTTLGVPQTTIAATGDEMDLVDAPNSTAVTAVQSGLSTHTAADVKTAVEAAGSKLTLVLEDTGTTMPGTLTTMTTHLTDIKGGTFVGATDSLEAIRDQGDSAWLTGAGGSAPTVGEIRAEIDSNSTQLAAIVEDTGTTIPGTISAMQGNVTDILADTNELQTDDVPGTLATIAGYIDTEVAAILEDTGTSIPALIATAQADLDKVTGTDGATLATAQGNYAPNKVVPDAAGTAATLHGVTDGKVDTIDGIVDAILVLIDGARGEPGQGALPVNPDLATKIDYLYKFLRNKVDTDATTISVYNDAGTTVDHLSTISDDGTDFTRGEFGTGA